MHIKVALYPEQQHISTFLSPCASVSELKSIKLIAETTWQAKCQKTDNFGGNVPVFFLRCVNYASSRALLHLKMKRRGICIGFKVQKASLDTLT